MFVFVFAVFDSSWAILCLKCLEYVTWGIACLHNKVCIGGAPHFALGDYSKYNACLTPSVLLLSWKNEAIIL